MKRKPFNHEPTYTNFHLDYARHQAHGPSERCKLCEMRGLNHPVTPNPKLFDLFSPHSERSEK